MILLSSIIDEFKDRFLEKYETSILPSHKNALRAMQQCRQEHGPQMLARCSNDDCQKQTYIPHSCGHRNCPHCQNHESWQWIENQLEKQLPAKYFLITFTLPKELRWLTFRYQQLIYSLMFLCVQETLKKFTLNDKKLQGQAGFTAILHTHSRRLDFHPHIHVVMPAASINCETKLWQVKSAKSIFYHKNLAKVFKSKLLQKMVDHQLQIPHDCPKEWVVDCKHVGNGDKALIYLGQYLYKGVIQEKDILKNENGMITFRYIDSKTKKSKTRTVTGEEFLWLLMLHVLPKHFRKTRCYGFLHPCSKKIIKLLQLILKFNPIKMLKKKKPRASIICKCCGSKMEIIQTMIFTTKHLQHAGSD